MLSVTCTCTCIVSHYYTIHLAPVAPTDGELSARAINSSHVELAVGLDGCNIHDEIQNYQICVSMVLTQCVKCTCTWFELDQVVNFI